MIKYLLQHTTLKNRRENMNKILFIDDNDRLYKFGSPIQGEFESCFTKTFKELLNNRCDLQCDYLCFNEEGQWQVFSNLNGTGSVFNEQLGIYLNNYIGDTDHCVIFIDFAWENVKIKLEWVLNEINHMQENKLNSIKKIYIYSARMPGEARDYVKSNAKNFEKICDKMGNACFDRSDLYDSCDYFKKYFNEASEELGIG